MDPSTNRGPRAAVFLFSAGMIALGTLSVISRDFAYTWQPVPTWLPGRAFFAVGCGAFMIVCGALLVFRATAAIAARAMFVFLLAWMGLKLPAILAAPSVEGVWLGVGEIGMLLAGGWVLLAIFSGLQESALRFLVGKRGIRKAQILFGLSVIPVGLGHIFYAQITASLIPPWLPFRVALAYLTGVWQIVCGLALLLAIYRRVAAWAESAMLALFALLVWGPDTWISSVPKMAGTPAGPRFPLTAFLITWVIGASAMLIATSIEPRKQGLLRQLELRNSDVTST